MNNIRGAKIIYQESKATQPSYLYFLQKDANNFDIIVTSESGVKRKLNSNVDLSNYYTKNEVDINLASKQDILTEDNLGQLMDLELATKSTPTSGDTVLGRDSLTGKAVEIPTSSFGGSGNVDTSNLVPYTGATKDVNIGSYFYESAIGFKKTDGEPNEYLMADGSTSTLPTDLIKGNGTTNYLPKFTASGTIGNSQIFDDGTKVGIGTSSPMYKIDVLDSVYTFARFKTTQSLGFINLMTPTSGTNYGALIGFSGVDFGLYHGDNAENSLYINGTSKNVGIGTTSPSEKLEVNGNIYIHQHFKLFGNKFGEKREMLSWDIPSQKLRLNYGFYGTDSYNGIDYFGYTHRWIGTGDYIQMSINSLGDVAIGLDNATEKLEVNGYTKATGFKTPNGTATQVLRADGNVFDLNTKADLVGGKVPKAQSQPSTMVMNNSTYVITFTDATGAVQTIDLPLESLFKDANYDAQTKSLIVTLQDGTTKTIPLTDLVDLPEIVLSNTNPSVTPTTGQKVYFNTFLGKVWFNVSGVWVFAGNLISDSEKTNLSNAYTHSQATGNPHGTTKSDIGLGNVDNTSDLDKPISTATQTALNTKANIVDIPSKTSFTHDILVSNWSLVSGKYEAVISNVGILADSFVDIIPSNDHVDIVRSAQIYPSVLISSGSVKVYSKFLPSGTISVTVNIN